MGFVKKKRGSMMLPRAIRRLLLAEGHAVGALVNSRVCLVGADQNAVQRAVVFAVAVVCALLDGTFDGLVCMTIHNEDPPFNWVLA